MDGIQHSLFDEGEDAQDDLPKSTWREVPQALFNSWGNERQLMYCAARDEDGALYANNMTEARWFAARAQSYREMAWQAREAVNASMRRLGEEM